MRLQPTNINRIKPAAHSMEERRSEHFVPLTLLLDDHIFPIEQMIYCMGRAHLRTNP